MPGFYADGEYDIAGFIVGLVDRARIVDGRTIVPGDVVLGLMSAGLHTNGYSLARQVLFERQRLPPDTVVPELGMSVADALLAPHRSYLRATLPLLEAGLVKGMAHITGGGITENLPRVLPPGCAAVIDPANWQTPAIFEMIQRLGDVPIDDMRRSFNMGIGLAIVCAANQADAALKMLVTTGEREARVIGRIERGDRFVRYSGQS
jgi:phosphoribosylformylglycinamidine cyclo-ligase